MIGAHGIERLEAVLRLRAAELGDVRYAVRCALKAHHIQSSDIDDGRAEQIGPLRDRAADQNAPRAAASSAKARGRGVLIRYQVLGARNEVVAFNLILESSTQSVANVSVSLSTLTGPGGATIQSQVTAPIFQIASSSNIFTTSSPQLITVYAEDANGYPHLTNENVVVTLASSSGVVGTTDSTVVTIVAGTYYTQAARFIPGAV